MIHQSQALNSVDQFNPASPGSNAH